MIAQRSALVINKRDNHVRSKVWASSHLLEVGTFVGIPFLFKPTGPTGACYLSALYVRFIEDLEPSESREAVSEFVGWMQRKNGRSASPFLPLIRLPKPVSKKPKLAVQKFEDEYRGIWYEVDGQFTDTPVAESGSK